MITAQPGIFAQGTRSHFQLEFKLNKGARVEEVRAALRGFREPAVTFGGANVVMGFSKRAWKMLLPDASPVELDDFAGVKGSKYSAPGTQRDVWVWIHGHGHDIVLDVARGAAHALAKVAKLELEVPCFVYRDSRDLLGFIDGTENPPVAAAPELTLFQSGAGAGGSIALAMKFVHDISKFQALDLKAQEKVIGRSRLDSVEMDDHAKPPTAHISRVVIEEDGEELEIYRRSVPYGGVNEHGLYFIAFTNQPWRIEAMLANMYGTAEDKLTDALLDYTRAVTGSYFFVPSLTDLARAIDL